MERNQSGSDANTGGIKTGVMNAWNTAKTNVSDALNAINTTVSNIWNTVKTNTSNTINKNGGCDQLRGSESEAKAWQCA